MLNRCSDPISEIIDRICQEEKVVIYTIGKDTRHLIQKIPEPVRSHFVYVDKKAADETVFFEGKQVMTPEKLLSIYKEYVIVVPTIKFGSEIYRQFIQMGIDLSRCIFNTGKMIY